LLCILLVAGCSNTIPKKQGGTGVSVETKKARSKKIEQALESNNRTYRELERFNQFYREWKGTPYRYGGISRRGVDCSAFTFIAYREVYDLVLPRMTREQMGIGRTVGREHLIVGDLLFFKTGAKVLHVGIYLGQDEFIHASTSIGVTKSNLNNPYWSPRFINARRLVY